LRASPDRYPLFTALAGAAVLLAGTALTPAAHAVATLPIGVGGFGYGQMQSQTIGTAGCGTNTAGEPSIHVSKANLVAAGSEEGAGSGSEYWRATEVGGTANPKFPPLIGS
jgi:hypothetical protein